MKLQDQSILITGGSGFLGSAVVSKLIERGMTKAKIYQPRSREFDLRRWSDCQTVVREMDVVIHLAAKVGGIGYNQTHAGELFYDNIMMSTQMMEAARQAKVKKYVAIGTVCAYPKFTPAPFKEESLWDGYPEETNAPYGLAKKMALVQAQSYRQQYGFNAIYLLLVNLYGPGDNFDLTNSHVIPALIRKVYEAKIKKLPVVEVWGTGKATREFLFIDDAANGIIQATEMYDGAEPVNLGSGQEISIQNLITTICRLMDYHGKIEWNTTKPDGQPRRLLNISRAKKFFNYAPTTDLETGLEKTIKWYLR
ncbi:MAG: GDP-L-fucose synthase [Patescibacteria group bacterium]